MSKRSVNTSGRRALVCQVKLVLMLLFFVVGLFVCVFLCFVVVVVVVLFFVFVFEDGGVYVLVFTCMPGESYRRSLLLYLCYIFRALINSLVCF